MLHDERMEGDIAHAGQRADADPAVDALDRGQRQIIEVDQVRRVLDIALHEVDQIRSAGYESCALARARGDCGRKIAGANVDEGIHARLPAASRTAATIPS